MSAYAYDAVRRKFTGKERDSESGLDNFGKRRVPHPSRTLRRVGKVKLAAMVFDFVRAIASHDALKNVTASPQLESISQALHFSTAQHVTSNLD